MVKIDVASEVAAAPADVWAVASTMAGVNAELGPWVRMTHPADKRSLADVQPGAHLGFDSWVLALGVLPFDRHHLHLETVIDPGDDVGPFGFDEESTSWMQRRWRHERRIEAIESGRTRVSDRLVVEPRVGLFRPIVRRVVPAIFRHRHRRLRRRFGAPTS